MIYWPLHDIPYNIEGDTNLCGRPHPFISMALRRHIFKMIHSLAYPSEHPTAKLMKQKFIWHSISGDSRHWVRACIPCQDSKVTRHTESRIGQFQQSSHRFGHIHVDIISPLPPLEGARYLFTITDRSRRWFKAILMAEASATSCADALLSGWISRFGVTTHHLRPRHTLHLAVLVFPCPDLRHFSPPYSTVKLGS